VALEVLVLVVVVLLEMTVAPVELVGLVPTFMLYQVSAQAVAVAAALVTAAAEEPAVPLVVAEAAEVAATPAAEPPVDKV
jgi:hypothetical protein